MWNLTQLGLQMTNPKVSMPIKSRSSANQRTFNPLNIEAQVAAGGLGIHIKREGLLSFLGQQRGYIDEKDILGQPEGGNRSDSMEDSKLTILHNDEILNQSSHNKPIKNKKEQGKFLNTINKIGDFLGKIGGSGGSDVLYDYVGGPGSVYGIGKTTIYKYKPYTTGEGTWLEQDAGSKGNIKDVYSNILINPENLGDGYITEGKYSIATYLDKKPDSIIDIYSDVGLDFMTLPIFSQYHNQMLSQQNPLEGDGFNNFQKRWEEGEDKVNNFEVYRLGDYTNEVQSHYNDNNTRNFGRNDGLVIVPDSKVIYDFKRNGLHNFILNNLTSPENDKNYYSIYSPEGPNANPNVKKLLGAGTYFKGLSQDIFSQTHHINAISENPRFDGNPGPENPLKLGDKGEHERIPLGIMDFRAIKRGIQVYEDETETIKNRGNFEDSQATNYQAQTNLNKPGVYFNRESRVATGTPGKLIHKESSNMKDKFGQSLSKADYDMFDIDTIDQINALDVFKATGNPPENEYMRDLIKLRIEALDGDNPNKSEVMLFRAFLDGYTDNFSGKWNSFKYNGRAEDFYTYGGFDRKISFSFKIAAQSRHEMMPLYRKLNFLTTQTAPDYKQTRMRGSLCRLTIGSLIYRTPGFFTAVGLKWNVNYPWDISINHLENGADKDGMNVMPHVLDVSCAFTPIHNFTPQKSVNKSPFILPSVGKRSQKWSAAESAKSADDAKIDNFSRIKKEWK